jgi:hypothetical protein
MSKRTDKSPPWFALPLDVADCDAVRRLNIRLGRADSWTHLWHAWVWCRRFLPSRRFSGPDAAARFEDAARWQTKGARAGRLASAALASGCLVETADGLELLDAEVLVAADWTRPGDTTEDKTEAQKAAARERAAKSYEAKKAQKTAAQSGAQTGADAAQNTRLLRADGSVSAASLRAETEERSLLPARETETETHTDTDTTKSTPVAPSPGADADASRGSPAGRVQQGLPGTTEKPDPKAAAKAAREAAVTEVLRHWQTAVERPGWAIEGRGSEKRRSRVAARLDEGLTVDELKAAADHVRNDPWLWGTKQDSPAGGYRDVQTVFRDRAQVERLRDLTQAPKGGGRVVPFRAGQMTEAQWLAQESGTEGLLEDAGWVEAKHGRA